MSAPRLTLSFDNGPWPGPTERILDILAERGLKASFFLVGERLADAAARACAVRAKAEGHVLGNHTLTHGAPLGERPAEDAVTEIEGGQIALGELAHPDKYFRPNGRGRLGPHLLSRAAVDHLTANGYTLVTWSAVPRDWEAPKRGWIERAMALITGEPASLIVLHDHHLADMLDTLPAFLDRVAEAGIEIVQDFPASCMPIRRGSVVGPLDGLASQQEQRRSA